MHCQPGHNVKTIWQEVACIARVSPQFSNFPRDEAIYSSRYDTLQFMFRGVWVDLKCIKLHSTQDNAISSSRCMRRAMESKSQSFCDIVLAFKLILHHHNCIRHHMAWDQGGLPKAIAMTCFAIAVLSNPYNARMWGLDEGILHQKSAAVSATDGYALLDGLLREFAIFQWKTTAIFVTEEGACTMMPKSDVSEPCEVWMEAQRNAVNGGDGNATRGVTRMQECQRKVEQLLERKSVQCLLREALDNQKLEEKFSHLEQFVDVDIMRRRIQAESGGDGLHVDSMGSTFQADSVGAVSSGGAGVNQIGDPSSPLFHLPPLSVTAHQQLHDDWSLWRPSMVSPPPSHATESTSNIGIAPPRPVSAASHAASDWSSNSAHIVPVSIPAAGVIQQCFPGGGLLNHDGLTEAPQNLNGIGCALSPPMASPPQSYVAAAASAWDGSSNSVPAPIQAAGVIEQCSPRGLGVHVVDGFTHVPFESPEQVPQPGPIPPPLKSPSDYTKPPPPPPLYPTGHPPMMYWVENGNKPFEPGFYHIEDEVDGAAVEVIVNPGSGAAEDPRAPIVVMVPGTDGFQDKKAKGYSGHRCIEVRIHCGGRSRVQGGTAKSWKRKFAGLVKNTLVTVRRWADSGGDASARERRHVGVIAFSRGASWMMTLLSESSALVDFAWLIAGCIPYCFFYSVFELCF